MHPHHFFGVQERTVMRKVLPIVDTKKLDGLPSTPSSTLYFKCACVQLQRLQPIAAARAVNLLAARGRGLFWFFMRSGVRRRHSAPHPVTREILLMPTTIVNYRPN